MLTENQIIRVTCWKDLQETMADLQQKDPAWTERMLLRFVRAFYTHQLRGLVALLPAEVTAEILAASENIAGPIGDISRN